MGSTTSVVTSIRGCSRRLLPRRVRTPRSRMSKETFQSTPFRTAPTRRPSMWAGRKSSAPSRSRQGRPSWTFARKRSNASETEEQQQVDARPLDHSERIERGRGRRVGKGRPYSKQLGEGELDRGLVVVHDAKVAAEPRDEAWCDFGADRDPRARAAKDIRGRLDLDRVDPNRLLERRNERRCDESRRQCSGANGQLLLLQARQLVGGRVEHDERQNV